MARHIPVVHNVTYGNINQLWTNERAFLYMEEDSMFGKSWKLIDKESELCSYIAGQVLHGRLKVIAVI
jgi:predicted secreted protein